MDEIITDDDRMKMMDYMYKLAEEEGLDEHQVDPLTCCILPGLENGLVIIGTVSPKNYKNYHIRIINEHFKTAVRINRIKYFHHGKYSDVFTDDQAKAFDDAMRHRVDGISCWELLKFFYNNEYPKHQLDKYVQQPDYSRLSQKKGSKK